MTKDLAFLNLLIDFSKDLNEFHAIDALASDMRFTPNTPYIVEDCQLQSVKNPHVVKNCILPSVR